MAIQALNDSASCCLPYLYREPASWEVLVMSKRRSQELSAGEELAAATK